MSRHTDIPRGSRRGFTLVELLIAMTMLAVVGATIVMALTTQQRFVRGTSDVGNMRSQIQAATTMLPLDLRGISSQGRDIIGMTDSEIRVRATIAASVVCAVAGNDLTLAPDAMYQSQGPAGAIPVRLTSIILKPSEATDSVFVWEHLAGSWNAAAGAGVPFAITKVEPATCATMHGRNFSNSSTIKLTLATLPPGGVAVGTAVRVVRHVRYGLYKSPVDEQWYLGYRDPGATQYEFVAGPFREYSASTSSGLRFTYFDTLNAATAVPTNVARIEVTARGRTERPVAITNGATPTTVEDWLRAAISIRNRN